MSDRHLPTTGIRIGGGRVLTLLVAVWQPVGWLFLLTLTVIQSAIWWVAVYRWLTRYPVNFDLEADEANTHSRQSGPDPAAT